MGGIARIVTPDRKCPVCNGPARVPSGFELAAIEGSIELAQEVTRQAEESMRHGQRTVLKMETLVEAAKLQGEQEARAALVRLED